MIFRSKVAWGDYHDNFDDTMFAKWINESLIPSFQRQYPGKRMVFVLVNATYHHVHPENSFFTSDKSIAKIERNLEEMDVDVDELSM